MKLMRKYKRYLIVLVAICTIFLAVKTLAYYTSMDQVTNQITIGDVDIEVTEKFEQPNHWDGTEWDKVVQIKNKSKSPALIRVAIVPRWVDASGSAWPGDTSIVTLNFVNILAEATVDPSGQWVNGNDGYYYYNAVVPTDGVTVELLNSVSATIPQDLKSRYEGKTLIVDVKAEAVQATTDAYHATWPTVGKSIQEMLNQLCAR